MFQVPGRRAAPLRIGRYTNFLDTTDLTWDDTSDNWYGGLDQRHLYFGLTDELMAIAHSDHTANYQKDDYAYRSTDLSNNYFVRNGKADEWTEKCAAANANI